MVVLHKDGKGKSFKVHQLVASAFLGHTLCGYSRVVDHIDNNPLNNCVDNLQIISPRENCSKDKKGGYSSHTGVSWSKRDNRWTSSIKINGKSKHLGNFINESDAARAYVIALSELSSKTSI